MAIIAPDLLYNNFHSPEFLTNTYKLAAINMQKNINYTCNNEANFLHSKKKLYALQSSNFFSLLVYTYARFSRAVPEAIKT